MSDVRNVYAKARAETAELFGFDPNNLTTEQSTRVDVVCALRIGIDDLQGKIVRGESVDVAKLLSASEALAKLLPAAVLATPPPDSHEEDPREIMWRTYKEMRDRGALVGEGLDGLKLTVERLQAENAVLKAQLAGSPASSDEPAAAEPAPADNVVPLRASAPAAQPKQPPGWDKPPTPPESYSGPVPVAPPKYDYNCDDSWKSYVLPSGDISSTPFGSGRGKYWGPV